MFLSLCVCSLSNAQPLEYGVYKPVMVLFGLVDGLQPILKVYRQSLLHGIYIP